MVISTVEISQTFVAFLELWALGLQVLRLNLHLQKTEISKGFMWFYLILETDVTHQLLVHNQVFRYGIKCCVGYIYPNFRRYVWSNMVFYYSKPIDYISCWVSPTDMYCCSCCYFCHPSWSWTQQQQRMRPFNKVRSNIVTERMGYILADSEILASRWRKVFEDLV